MVKSRFMRIVLIVASILIIVGIALMAWVMWFADRDVIVVKLKDDEAQSIPFEGFGLVPGESCEYALELRHDAAGTCEVRLQFVEHEEKALREFAYIKIVSRDRVLCDERMADLFEGDGIVIPVDFDTGANTELKIVYYLPIEVGNEAKGAEAVFELVLTACNE